MRVLVCTPAGGGQVTTITVERLRRANGDLVLVDSTDDEDAELVELTISVSGHVTPDDDGDMHSPPDGGDIEDFESTYDDEPFALTADERERAEEALRAEEPDCDGPESAPYVDPLRAMEVSL